MITLEKTKAALPYVGYGLVVFSILDLLIYLIPIRFFDFNWEFNTFNYFVDSSPGSIVGFWIVLSREFNESINKYIIEKTLIRFLAWSTLFLSIIYFLLIPVGVSAAFRLYKNTNAQFMFQQSNGIAQVEQIRSKIKTASDRDLAGLQKQIPNDSKTSIPFQSPSTFRQSLLEQIDNQANSVRAQTAQAIKNNREVVLKRTLKSLVGAVIVGLLFLRFWLQDPKRRMAIGLRKV